MNFLSVGNNAITLSKFSSPKVDNHKEKTSILIFFFLLGLLLPIQIFLGPVRLSPYRIILLLTSIPLIFMWLSGKAGQKYTADILIVGFSAWATLSVIVVHGISESIEKAGIFFVETVGAYMIARCLIRSPQQYKSMVVFLCLSIIAMIPLALIETVTARPILLDFLGRFLRVFDNVPHEIRWGLDRAQVVFEHPILYGVFCASAIGLAFYVLGYKKSIVTSSIYSAFIALATTLSLSSGPLTGVVMQYGLIGYDVVTKKIRGRWWLLLLFCLMAFIVVDIISNRTPFEVFISYLTFNSDTAYNRVLIWHYGTAEIMRHPVFGIGFNEWERAWHMSTSLDMFWLLQAVRYGLPAFILLAAAFIIICWNLTRLKNVDPRIGAYRKGLLITLISFMIVGWTVHFWNATYCLFMFLLGSGVWMLDKNNYNEDQEEPCKQEPLIKVVKHRKILE